MAERVFLAQLMDNLPTYTGDELVVEPDESFRLGLERPPNYVWPSLELDRTDPECTVLLVAAPGAGGKSAAAEAIAHRLNAPLVDLSKLQVGSASMTGLLANVLGWDQAPTYIKQLREGTRALVMDGLDEAQLFAGHAHFVAFLQDLASLLKGANPVRQVIILGRHDSIETAELALSEMDVPIKIARIAPLSWEQSGELINLTLDDRVLPDGSDYDVHRKYAKPFAALRDQVFGDIAAALGNSASGGVLEWQASETFLGYPPVLLVLAEFLAVDNPEAERSSRAIHVSGPTNRSSQGALLRQVVEQILDRESQKVRKQLAKAIPAVEKCEQALYGREEQSLRILQLATPATIDLVAPASLLSSDDRVRYEEQLSGFVRDHPFLIGRKFANIVFSDYVRAFIATSPVAAAHGLSVRGLLSASPPPGPFFAHFVYALSSDLSDVSEPDYVNDTSAQLVPLGTAAESLVDDLIKSFASGTTNNCFATYNHLGEDAVLMLSELTEERRSIEPSSNFSFISFAIDDASGVLELSSPLVRTFIVSDYGVCLTSRTDEIEVGPAVFLIVNEIDIRASKFTAIGGSTDNVASVSLMTETVRHSTELKVAAYPSTALRAFWSDVWHQWKPYSPKISSVGTFINRRASYQVMLDARRILTSFRKAGARSAPSAYWEMLERMIVGRNPISMAVLAGLIELELISRQGPMYRLNLEALGKHGVSYAALRGPDFEQVLSSLHAVLVKTDAVLSAVSHPKK